MTHSKEPKMPIPEKLSTVVDDIQKIIEAGYELRRRILEIQAEIMLTTINRPVIPPNKPDERLSRKLTVKEAAEQLRLKPGTIYHYVMTKQIPFYKIGSKVFFNQEQLIAWFESKRVKTDAELNEIVKQKISKREVKK